MPTHTIMDHTGHTEKVWDKADVVGVEEAMQRFEKMTRDGYTAVAVAPEGAPGRRLDKFDPNVEETMFIPRLVGG